MPSSDKTPRLGLNRWSGGDKPKKDDFNADNGLLDAAFGGLSERLRELEETSEAGSAEAVRALESHTADTGIHITPEERAAWSRGGSGMVIGTYEGEGTSTRSITLGFRPRFGILYAVGCGPVETYWAGQESRTYLGFFGAAGCSLHLSVQANGFSVASHVNRPMDGLGYKYNEYGVTYVYVAWPE